MKYGDIRPIKKIRNGRVKGKKIRYIGQPSRSFNIWRIGGLSVS